MVSSVTLSGANAAHLLKGRTVTNIIRIDPRLADDVQLAPAVEILRQGGVVAGPTETFYGLMASAGSPEAVARVAELKGRDGRKPLLLLMDRPERAFDYAEEILPEAEALIKAFWPGPLTLLLASRPDLHPFLVGSGGTVGLRVEGLPLVRRLVAGLDQAVTGTSANPGGAPPADTAEKVQEYFGSRVDLIIDSGTCPGGHPSTLVEASHTPFRLLRNGAISLDRLRAVVPEIIA